MARSPDSDSENEQIEMYISKSIELFKQNQIWRKNSYGIFSLNGLDDSVHHPLLASLEAKRKRKNKMA
jgi:hypothetical protein